MNFEDYEHLRKLIGELHAQTHMIAAKGTPCSTACWTTSRKTISVCGLASTVDRAKRVVEKIKPAAPEDAPRQSS
jgi:hypothetical protein